MILRRIPWLAFLVLILFLAPAVSHGGEQPGQVQLTAQEQQFIEEHPVIRVSNEMDWPPFDFAENGKPQGYDIDYLRLLESRLPGLRFEFVNGYAWGELVDMVGDRKIDLLHPTPILAKRREEILFSEQPILEMVLVLVVRQDAGDECLKAVAAKLNASASRPADLAARYGGEEFVILLPNTDMGGACTLAEAIRQEIEQLGIAHEGSGVSSTVSLSFGVATLLPTKEQLPGDLIGAADKALYQAKENGRNRVEQAESS